MINLFRVDEKKIILIQDVIRRKSSSPQHVYCQIYHFLYLCLTYTASDSFSGRHLGGLGTLPYNMNNGRFVFVFIAIESQSRDTVIAARSIVFNLRCVNISRDESVSFLNYY